MAALAAKEPALEAVRSADGCPVASRPEGLV